jgi:deoxyxylulose-5-phosphate synthase
MTGRPVSGHRPRIANLGVPVQFIPHGKPDDILASLGLDAPGIAASVRRLLSTHTVDALH